MKLTLNNLVSAALAASLVVPTAFGQGLEDVEKKLSAVLAKAQEKNRFVGLSVLVIDKDRGSFKKHYGFRDHARTLAPDDDTMYEIGSITKVFARLALAAQDKIKPDDLLSQHLPEGIRAPRPHGEDITIKQLMTHTSAIMAGMPCLYNKEDPQKPKCYGFDPSPDARNPAESGTRELTFKFAHDYSYFADEYAEVIPKPGYFFLYSNIGIGILGELLGVQHGSTFEKVLTDGVLAPLKMSRTKIEMPCAKDKSCINVADTHQITKDGSKWQPWEMTKIPGMPAAGALKSTLSDLEKFVLANMNPDDSPIGAVLKLGQSALPDVSAQHNANICKEGEERFKHLCNESNSIFNFAWSNRGHTKYFMHGGITYGSQAFTLVTQDRRQAIVVLSNASYFGAKKEMHVPLFVTGCLVGILHGGSEKNPNCDLLAE